MRQEAQHTTRQTDRQTENKNAKLPPFCRMQNPTDKCGSRSKREKVLQEVESAKKSTRSFIHTCGWFLRHALRSSAKRPRAIPPDIAPGAPLPRFVPFVSHSSERERERGEEKPTPVSRFPHTRLIPKTQVPYHVPKATTGQIKTNPSPIVGPWDLKKVAGSNSVVCRWNT
jgi:hypothetical protein